MSTDLEEVAARIETGESYPDVVLVTGNAVLSEPAGKRIAEALAKRLGGNVQRVRRPPELAHVLQDLKTYSLFEQAKVVLVIESDVLADRSAVAELMDSIADAAPFGEGELSEKERAAASRLLQALNLFGIDPAGTPEDTVGKLPPWVFQGGLRVRKKNRRGRGKKQVAELRDWAEQLLARALDEGLQGYAESDAVELGQLVESGLPEGHALVLVESRCPKDHPLVGRLSRNHGFISLGEVAQDRRGAWSGVAEMAVELERETGVGIDRGALDELVRRTVRKEARGNEVDTQSTGRFAAEYRKLALLEAPGSRRQRISLESVRLAIEDRGDEDVWKLLDAVSDGRPQEAAAKLGRYLSSASEPVAARLSLFSLLAEFSRQLAAVCGIVELGHVRMGVRSYKSFQSEVAPKLQGRLPGGQPSPVAKLHPFRLFRVYQAAPRWRESAAHLPGLALAAEMRLKGESGSPEAALFALVLTLTVGERVGEWTGSQLAS